MSTLNHMRRGTSRPVTAAVRHEQLAKLVEVQSPLVAATMRENLELMPYRVVSPYARTQLDALIVGRTWLADSCIIEDALVSIKPAVRSPDKTVQRLVGILKSEAIEEDLRRPIWLVIPIAVWDVEKLWRGADPDAPVPDCEATDEIQSFDKDLTRFELAITVFVRKDYSSPPSLLWLGFWPPALSTGLPLPSGRSSSSPSGSSSSGLPCSLAFTRSMISRLFRWSDSTLAILFSI